ncbi:hypothetical protein, partial [Mesorhizobium sp. B2-5-13]|uniref:hypothetical protein n=1 Tax=Mesorhizobium sp. B2-5-13 TaxID=2589917 RepID=UPI001AEEF33D
LLSLQRAESVTHLSGMNCHPSLGKGTFPDLPFRRSSYAYVLQGAEIAHLFAREGAARRVSRNFGVFGPTEHRGGIFVGIGHPVGIETAKGRPYEWPFLM